jgi:hypothetical protein
VLDDADPVVDDERVEPLDVGQRRYHVARQRRPVVVVVPHQPAPPPQFEADAPPGGPQRGPDDALLVGLDRRRAGGRHRLAHQIEDRRRLTLDPRTRPELDRGSVAGLVRRRLGAVIVALSSVERPGRAWSRSATTAPTVGR